MSPHPLKPRMKSSPSRFTTVTRALALLLMCPPVTPVALTSAPPAALAQPLAQSYEQRLYQANLYMRQELYAQALIELETLLRTPQGSVDVRVVTAAAEASYKTHDITKALEYLRVARRLSQDPMQRQSLSDRYEAWSSEYGPVRFESANALRFGALTLESERKILSPERREVFEVARARLAQGITPPLSLYLPYGAYLANQVPFQLVPSRPMPIVVAPLTPISAPIDPPQAPSSSNKWVYVSLGGALVVAILTGVYIATSDPEPRSARLLIK